MINLNLAMSRCRILCVATFAALVVAGCGFGMNAEAKIERGQQAFDEGRYEAAVIDARNVLLDEPDNIAARILLARALIEMSDGVTAEKDLRRAMELGAAPDETLEHLGRALLAQGKFRAVVDELSPDAVTSPEARLKVSRVLAHGLVGVQRTAEARELYAEVLRSEDDDVEAQLGIVNSYVVDGNYVQARATMNEILTVHDDDVAAWLSSASLGIRTRDTARAAGDFQRALTLLQGRSDPPREMRALSGFAEAVLIDGRADEARPALERMRALAPSDVRTMLLAARLAAVDRDWITAQVQLQEILRQVPDFRPAQMLLGVVHKQSGNLRQAEMYLSAVVAAAPDNADARRLLAETRLELNQATAAREVIDSLVAGPNADSRSLAIAAAASLDLGEFDDAAALLRRRLAIDPDNVDLRIQLALAYFRSGDTEEVRALLQDVPGGNEWDEFRRDLLLVMVDVMSADAGSAGAVAGLLERWPDQPDAWNLAGSIDMANDDRAAARAKFSRASELAPQDANPIRYLAQLDEIEEDPESARTRYLKILEIDAADAPAMLALSRLAAQAEQPAVALDWLEQARLADPGAIAPRALLGARYLAGGNFAAAAAVAREGLEIDAANARLRNILGQALFAAGDFAGARNEFRQAASSDTEEPLYALNVARAEDRLGNTADAIATLEVSMRRTLQHLPSGMLLAWLHLKSADLAAAEGIAERLRSAHPGDASPHALQGEVLLRRGDLAGASAAYDRAMALRVEPRLAVRATQIRRQAKLGQPLAPVTQYLEERPFDTPVRLLLAQFLRSDGQDQQAIEQYARILEYEPDNLIAGNNLAWAYFNAGDARAESVARQSYATHPQNGAVIDTLGWILVNNGELQSGLALLRDAERLSQGSSEVRYHLAAALAQVGEREEARRLLEDLLAADASFASREAAERLLATL